MNLRPLVFTLAAVFALPLAASGAELSRAQTAALVAYLHAVQARNFASAFALLTKGQQAYFKTSQNFESVFRSDRFALQSYNIAAVRAEQGKNAVVEVGERVSFFDPAHQQQIAGNVKALYGVLDEGGVYRIRDRFHPVKAFAPAGANATQERLAVTIRKVSYYPDRVEVVVSFANTGDGVVTLFPYGRSVLVDEAAGKRYVTVDSRTAARIDNELFLGLRLPTGAQYTGIVAFRLPEQGAPRKFSVTFGPMLREGADQPFELSIPDLAAPF